MIIWLFQTMGYAPDFIQSVMKVLIKPIKKKGRGWLGSTIVKQWSDLSWRYWIKCFLWLSNWILYSTNTFYGVVHLFSNRSQMLSKWGKNKKVAHVAQLSMSPDYITDNVVYDLSLYRPSGSIESNCFIW